MPKPIRRIFIAMILLLIPALPAARSQDKPDTPASPERKIVAFDSYEIALEVENSQRMYAHRVRIDFYQGKKKVGELKTRLEMLGQGVATLENGMIKLAFPWDHYAPIVDLLRHEKPLALYVDHLPAKPGEPLVITRGGLTTTKTK